MPKLGWCALRREVMSQAHGTGARYSNELKRRLIEEARIFRAAGWSWQRIGRALGGVSHTSLRCWCEAWVSDAEPATFVLVAVVDADAERRC